MKRNNNYISIYNKRIQSKLNNNIQFKLDNNLYNLFEELNIVIKAT